ncbi:MAG: prepilin peptidase [Spirochaetes bacterium]|nr:prepilin peptidase [Spirochaetota bacterium]
MDVIFAKTLIPAGIGILFAIWHSFADALAWRIYAAYYSPQRKSIPQKVSFIFSQSSVCEYCAAKVSWLGLIPVAGFFLVGRRCQNCTRPISWRFPVFEALAFVFGLCVGSMNTAPLEFAVILVAYLLLWIVINVDYRVLLIPTEAILGLLLLGIFNLLVVRYPQWFLFNNFDLALDLAVSFVWYFFFHLLRILSGYKMGLADVRLVLALGFLLGHPYAMYLPGFAAALAIIFYLLRRRSLLIYAPSETQIPFGVFLGIGYLLLYLVRGWAA